jgi:cysteine-rich repeat protein
MRVEECDDGNMVNNDGCSSMCKLEFCYSLQNTGAEDLNNNTWLDACLAAPGSGVKVRLLDGNNNVVYEASGAKVGVWTADQWTSTTAPTNQYLVSNHNRLVALNNGDKLMITGRNSSNSGCGGSFGNGYGIVIYPANPNYYSNPKMIVMPYRLQVGTMNPRNFNSWTPGHEISWNNGNAMNTCNGPVTAFTGTFQLQITP